MGYYIKITIMIIRKFNPKSETLRLKFYNYNEKTQYKLTLQIINVSSAPL